MRLPEDEHCDTAKSVDQLGRAPATASVRYVSVQLVLGLTRRVHWVFYGFLALGVRILGRVRVRVLALVVGSCSRVLGLALGLVRGLGLVRVLGRGLALAVGTCTWTC